MTSQEVACAIVARWHDPQGQCGPMGPGHLQTNLVAWIVEAIDAAVAATREEDRKAICQDCRGGIPLTVDGYGWHEHTGDPRGYRLCQAREILRLS